MRGQDHVTEPLRQALRTGRVHHAYLFSGPRGCGKTSSARILARSLNCAEGPTPDPCGKCESCIALAPDGPGSLDVIEIDAASHGGVDDARDLRERAFYAPVSGRFKIYIIDEAHMVTREGFNALLKLVEEPPPHLKFVFATTEPEKVIATIRSRTHHYPFRLVPPATLRDLLEQILAAERISYEPTVLPLVVRAGAGSVRDSLSVLDQLLAGAGETGCPTTGPWRCSATPTTTCWTRWWTAFAGGDGAAVFRAVDRVMEGGHDPRRFAADLLDRFRDLIVLAAVPDAGQTGLLDLPADRLDRMTEQAGGFGQAELTRAAEIISEGLVQMRGATSPRLLLELMCAQVLLPAAEPARRPCWPGWNGWSAGWRAPSPGTPPPPPSPPARLPLSTPRPSLSTPPGSTPRSPGRRHAARHAAARPRRERRECAAPRPAPEISGPDGRGSRPGPGRPRAPPRPPSPRPLRRKPSGPGRPLGPAKPPSPRSPPGPRNQPGPGNPPGPGNLPGPGNPRRPPRPSRPPQPQPGRQPRPSRHPRPRPRRPAARSAPRSSGSAGRRSWRR